MSDDLTARLRARACPAGEPWTGDNPAEDHGHTDCWLYHQAADEIERFRKQNAILHRTVNMQPDFARATMKIEAERDALAMSLEMTHAEMRDQADDNADCIQQRDALQAAIDKVAFFHPTTHGKPCGICEALGRYDTALTQGGEG